MNMFTLGIPKRQYRRTTQVLGHEGSSPIEYVDQKQDDGFYVFSFDVDYDEFKKIVLLLKRNGITTIGADSQLTEKKIMKLADLIKESPYSTVPNQETEFNIIEMLKQMVTSWNSPTYKGGNVGACLRSDHFLQDLEEFIEDYEENLILNMPDTSINEQKLRKLIRDEFKKIS